VWGVAHPVPPHPVPPHPVVQPPECQVLRPQIDHLTPLADGAPLIPASLEQVRAVDARCDQVRGQRTRQRLDDQRAEPRESLGRARRKKLISSTAATTDDDERSANLFEHRL
jgi:hypothetical protein